MNPHDNKWIKRIMTVTSFPGLKDEISLIGRQLGFEYFAFRGCFPNLRRGNGEIAFDTCPGGWREYYAAHAIATESDCLHGRALQEVTPLLWRELFAHRTRNWARSDASQSATGVMFPVHGPAGQWSALNMIKASGGVCAERDILSTLADCQLLANYVHGAAIRLIRRHPETVPSGICSLPDVALSERERECLTLTAAGNTAAATAEKLSISQRTVVFHLSNARRKLGTTHSSQAVIKALSMGLIAAHAPAYEPLAARRG